MNKTAYKLTRAFLVLVLVSFFNISDVAFARDAENCQGLSLSKLKKDSSVLKSCKDKEELVGTLEIWHFDYKDKKESTKYYLNDGKKSREILPFGDTDKLKSGKKVKLKGKNVADSFVFDSSADVFNASGSALPSTPTSSNPETAGDQKTLVLLVNFSNTPTPNIAPAQVEDLVFNQMNSFYTDSSFGKTSVSGDVYGWYDLPIADTCSTSTFMQNAISVADPAVDFSQYSRIIFYAPFNINNCGWSGISSVGKTSVSTGDGAFLMSRSIVNTDFMDLYTTTHEYGHALGVQHAQVLNCGSVSMTSNTPSCGYHEYGDPFSVMGYLLGDMNAPHKEMLGWLDSTEIQNITTDGVYTILPIESNALGLKAIKIQRSETDYMYLEYRQPIGIDTVLNNIVGGSDVFSGALIHILGVGKKTMLVDSTPANDARSSSFKVGETLIDPATNTSVTVLSLDSNSMSVSVDVGNIDFNYPTVSIVSPASASTISGVTPILVDAYSSVGIQSVSFFRMNETVPFAVSSTAPYTALLDTTQIPNGYTSILVVATGNNGLTRSTGFLYQVSNASSDTIPPVVNIVAPADNSVVPPMNILVSANITDNNSVHSAEFYLDNNLVPFFTDYTAPFTTAIPSLSYGAHSVKVVAKDLALNVSVPSVVNFNVSPPDATPPTAYLSSPYEGAQLSGVVNVGASFYDNVGVAFGKLFVDGDLYYTWVNSNNASMSPVYTTWDTSLLDPGSLHTLYLEATDYAGNTSNSVVRNVSIFLPDTLAPTTSISTPLAGSSVSSPVSITATASDNVGVTKVEIFVDGTLVASPTSSPYTYLATLTPGAHSTYSKAYDAAGNTTTSGTISFTVTDTLAPTTSISTPLAGSSVSSPVSITATASDNVGVTKVEIFVDGTLVASPTSSPYTYLATLTPGAHSTYSKAYDAAGNTTTSGTISFTVTDTLAPTTSISTPLAGSSVSSPVSITATASDNVGVTKVEIFVDGTLVASPTSSPYTYLATLTPGAHSTYSKAYDAAGNTTTSGTISFTVTDTLAPTTSISTPLAGSSVSSPVSITATASDNVGVTKVEIFVDGTLVASPTSSPYTYLATLTPGAHSTYSKAYDAAGNTTTSGTISFTVTDTLAPTVAVTSPINGGTVSRSTKVTIRATASDNIGVTKVEFYVNNVLKGTDTSSPYTYVWSVPSTRNVVYTLMAKAYDAAGNTKTASVTVTSK